ncbi:mechanosensitive ion channel family protein [Hymenobacter glacialis]|uniref:Mechanosensitive ion channel protein MscS n=1 Tax=Hymenobacter glacialis TaxID=1908236 RepID=A0A1G1SVD5_9BACT|nr:mechanosensitive ion channel domain-containing protein [Hymenobacter glacialis]OGX82564.1 mechanosensitive ion channel protein MscS [Hymenobacter glacialis]
MAEKVQQWMEQFPDTMVGVLVVVGSIVGGLLLKYLIAVGLRAYERRQASPLVASVRQHLAHPVSYFFPILLLSLLLPLVPLEARPFELLRRVVEIAFIASFAWGLMRAVEVAEDLVLAHYSLSEGDNLQIRKLFTQLQFVKKVVVSLIFFVAVALVLMSFATVRRVGTGLLTSAGIASVIIGFAAQRSIGNLLAGFQLAFTQPLRIDDVLVVEGEWGRVEEITFTNVVMALWDERRLVLPLNYFIEKPFQNWTRNSAKITGSVFLQVDYTMPVEAIRTELRRILEAHPLWDGRACVLHVTEAKESTLELRALVSAADASSVWELRCAVREQLVTFVQQQYPECLPKIRARLDAPVAPAGPGERG